ELAGPEKAKSMQRFPGSSERKRASKEFLASVRKSERKRAEHR
ncbi:hypothetical protein A2U01_0062367, partial [Trifolium medium]|nr:hypothetical protein [Trifolium medium]